MAKATAKYERLTEALRRAITAAELAVAENPEDGGTCNFDSPALLLPRWNEKRVEEAAKKAGCGCFKWDCCGTGYFVFPIRVGGQGNSRTLAAETAKDSLAAEGYHASVYYQMD